MMVKVYFTEKKREKDFFLGKCEKSNLQTLCDFIKQKQLDIIMDDEKESPKYKVGKIELVLHQDPKRLYFVLERK